MKITTRLSFIALIILLLHITTACERQRIVTKDNTLPLWLTEEKSVESSSFEVHVIPNYHVGNTNSISEDQKQIINWFSNQIKSVSNTDITILDNDEALGNEGYRMYVKNNVLFIEANTGAGAFYAAFAARRIEATEGSLPSQPLVEKPQFDLRVLNHWDNLDGTVERGYAGKSLWKWEQLPDTISPRYAAYALSCASVGINTVVFNNVNASPEILTDEYLVKVAALANVFRPYNIKVMLSVNFSSPSALDKSIKDADPLRPEVRAWWKERADKIYELIPDFAGFLVKANSEGLPGPLDFGRTHADGANMLAEALEPHNGIVMWRAFVYSPSDADRAKQAYLEFKPYDGQFKDNVIIQIKNGPIDFQPREPFSPLFGALQKTDMMVELQITQEYTGHANHLCYLSPMWKECLDADTYNGTDHSTIKAQTKAAKISAIAGVTNLGDDEVWCANELAQANWYAFGRLAWNPDLSSEQIAKEWIAQSFQTMPAKEKASMEKMLCDSREMVVDYMMPLGLHHIFAWGHHYGPEPWCAIPGARPDWMPSYYHRADEAGLGFDRSPSGSKGNEQYNAPLSELYGNIEKCPDEYLLWFHHAAWDRKMQSGRTLWDELCYRYNRGMQAAEAQYQLWQSFKPYMSAAAWENVNHRLDIQAKDARWWHDGCLLYFQTFSKMPIPEGTVYKLEDMQKFHIKIDNYTCAPAGFVN
ncbi:MAG: alpha-glucuronidase [Bacteroidales bacterium]|nr:alpha-glucuronidase [Bacteroidales bacterium]